MWKT
ncbi:hemolysin-type calcium-binding repeat family domain protein, partial [Vibrio parahaemolyticus V-223/04]|jgi:hypothetical protein